MENVGATTESERTPTFKCPYPNCKAKFLRADRLSAHVCVHDEQRDFVCCVDGCNKAYTRPHHLRRHVETVHNLKPSTEGFKCSEEGCGKINFTLLGLEQHYKKVHSDNFLKTHAHKCAHCSRHFSTAASLSCHEYTHTGVPYSSPAAVCKSTGRHKCPHADCHKEFGRPSKLAAHMKFHANQRDFVCQVDGCNKAYTRQQHLSRHIAIFHHRKTITTEFICTEEGCGKSFKTSVSVKRHYEKAHTDKFKRSHPHKCVHCNLRFRTANKLAYHEYTHTGVAPYTCDICEMKFTDVSLLKRHLRYNHRKKSFKCPENECMEVFSEASLLEEHKISHQKETHCPICKKGFSSKRSLNLHLETHKERERRELFFCHHLDCSRSYTNKFSLEQHMLSKHEGMKLACQHPGCGKSLVTKQKLQEHMALHNPDHPMPQPKYTVRNQRKDAGKPKRSMAVRLSGFKVPHEVEKSILQGKPIKEEDINSEAFKRDLHESEDSHNVCMQTKDLKNENVSQIHEANMPDQRNKKIRLKPKEFSLFFSTDECDSEC